MVYVSETQPREEEASCIDLSLDVGRPVREALGSLGYYPTYARISPNQRANYLRWLSSSRVAPLNDIGYAFLFFYGLERRLLIEQQDLSPIVKEVVRLLETYTFSGSFDGYLSRFLAFTLARGGIETLKDKWFEAVFDKSRLQRDEDFLAVALAWFFKKNAPLPVSWAMRIARQDPRCPRSVMLDRLPEQFKSLFEKRYHEQFGEGMILKASKRDRSLSYRPASPSHFCFRYSRLVQSIHRTDQDPQRPGDSKPVLPLGGHLVELHRGATAAEPSDGQGYRGRHPRSVRGSS